jgi:hypothetical protein
MPMLQASGIPLVTALATAVHNGISAHMVEHRLRRLGNGYVSKAFAKLGSLVVLGVAVAILLNYSRKALFE